MSKTSDYGLILAGTTNKIDYNNYDPFFIKLNSCGEKEWCKIFSTPGNSDYGVKIKQIPDGYIALVKYFQDWRQKRIWLFKLDTMGEPVWQKLYANNDSNIRGEEGRDIAIASDGGYIISGDGYYYDSVLQLYRLRPLIIKTDSAGNEQWTLNYGLSTGFRGDGSMSPTEHPTGFFYCTARHFRDSVPLGNSPSFIKFDLEGNEVYHRDLIPDSKTGGSCTLNFINDSVMIISAGWSYQTSIGDTNGIIKTDTLGVILKKKNIFNNVYTSFEAAITTFDNKYLVTGGWQDNGAPAHIYLYKLNYNLDFDTIYTVPRVYDSLCPYPIVSDTTDLDDCGVITALKEPEVYIRECRLKIYPNPAREQVAVELPDNLVTISHGTRFQSTTIYHQWRSVRLDVFDLEGRLMYTAEIPKENKTVPVQISSWPDGMYYARIVFMNQVVADGKVVKR